MRRWVLGSRVWTGGLCLRGMDVEVGDSSAFCVREVSAWTTNPEVTVIWLFPVTRKEHKYSSGAIGPRQVPAAPLSHLSLFCPFLCDSAEGLCRLGTPPCSCMKADPLASAEAALGTSQRSRAPGTSRPGWHNGRRAPAAHTFLLPGSGPPAQHC